MSLSPAPVRRPAPRPLTVTMVRRRPPRLLLAPPAPAVPVPPADGGALRFFVTCYAAGLVFFLVMLS